MSETHGQRGGTLEPHSFGGGGYGRPQTPSSKDQHHYNNSGSNNNSTSNSHGGSNSLTELTSNSDSSNLTLLKNAPVSNSSSSPHSNTNSSGITTFTSLVDTDNYGGTRYTSLDNFYDMQMQTSWDPIYMDGRQEDIRSTDSPDNGSQSTYRPWEKQDPNTNQPNHQSPTSTNTTNGAILVSTTTSENGISSTNGNNDKSPTTLTPLTNVQPLPVLTAFQEAFTKPSFVNSCPENQSPVHLLPSQFFVDGAPTNFHPLPSNRGYGHNHLHNTGSHGGPPTTTIVTTQAQPYHPIFEPYFPVQLGPGHGQLIPTFTTGPPTMTISSNGGNNLGSPHGHPHHFNGNGVNGGNYNGIIPPSPSPSSVAPPTSTGGTTHLQELVPAPHMHTSFYTTSPLTNNNSGNKLPPPQQTTDGNIPGLNLNIIPNPHHDSHHLSLAHSHHPPPTQTNPKLLHGAGIADYNMYNNIEPHHIITFKLHDPPQHNQMNSNYQLPPHGPHIIHHQAGVEHHHISKLEQQQCSPQIVSTNTNGNRNGGSNNNGNTNGTNGTPKRQVNRKRKAMDHQHLHNNHNNHQQGGMLGDNGMTHISNDLNDPQVSSVSSTDSDFKRPNLGAIHGNGLNGNGLGHGGMGDGVDAGLDKPVKKKRKRCGECTGCQRKDNCGDCAPCRNDKSHQICKMRRCDKLTEKKTPKVKLKQQQQQQQHG